MVFCYQNCSDLLCTVRKKGSSDIEKLDIMFQTKNKAKLALICGTQSGTYVAKRQKHFS